MNKIFSKIGSAFKFLWSDIVTRAWVISGTMLIVLMLVVSILASTVLYSVLGMLWGTSTSGGRGDWTYYETVSTSKENALELGNALNEEICEEGFVLLKNENDCLPLNSSETKVSVFGKNSVNLVYGGSGSSNAFDMSNITTIHSALEAEGFSVNPTLKDFYDSTSASGSGRPADLSIENGVVNKIATGETPQSSYTDAVKASYSEYDDAAIVVISRIGGEGWDLPYGSDEDGKHYLELDSNEEALIDEVSKSFDKVIVLLNSSNIIEPGYIQSHEGVDAFMFIGGVGFDGINALGRILNGEVNPSGKTVDTWASDFTASPVWTNFGDTLDGAEAQYINNDSTDLYYYVDYEEGIYMGHNYYETRGETDGEDWYNSQVVYPFGYGLSYTDFAWEVTNADDLASFELTDDNKTEMIDITVEVTNNGAVAGKDVVEIYAKAPYEPGEIEKSSAVLVGFAKTDMIAPNASDEVTISVNPYYIASYDYNDANDNGFKGYELDGGTYYLDIKTDSHNKKANVDSLEFTIADGGLKYEYDPTTGTKVENRYDDADDELSTVLSRNDWAGTWPTLPENEVKRVIGDGVTTSFTYAEVSSILPNTPQDVIDSYEMPTQGAEGSKQLIELRGLDYDDAEWDELLDQMTLDEMRDLYNYCAYKTTAVSSIGLPATLSADGPVGLTQFMGLTDVYGTTWFASEPVVASTWNTDLAYEQGIQIGEESAWGKQNGTYTPYTGWYSPGVNLHRSPFGGRNAEYYSEDAFLTGKMASSVISGAKEMGLVTYMKHFALNDQESYRDDNGILTWATEQSIREIYFRAFEIGVKEGGSNGIMTSFNRIGSVWTGGDYRLITNVLREEWGFEGAVICDFNITSYMGTKMMCYAGGDSNLSTTRYWTKADATVASDVSVLRNSAHNLLYVLVNSNAMNGIDENTVLSSIMPAWQIILYVVDAVIVLGVGAWGLCSIMYVKKKAKAKNEEIELK